MHLKPRLVSTAACLAFASTLCLAQQVMDNAAVIKLAGSGLSEDLIVQTITASAGHYDTSTDSLIALKKAGVTDKEVGAMLNKNLTPSGSAPAAIATSAASGAPAGITDVGVYYLTPQGAYEDVAAEIVNYKTGGVLKGMASGGLIKGDLNGNINGAASKTKLNSPATFVIYVMEGQSPNEYQLLHLRPSKDYREFRSKTGGVVHQSSGASRDMVEFEAKKIAPRMYQVILPPTVGKGEFGFLPPSTMNSGNNLASSGKIFSFTIVE